MTPQTMDDYYRRVGGRGPVPLTWNYGELEYFVFWVV